VAANVFDHLKATYFQECAELLESTYAHLLALEEDRADADTIHAIFRAVHSIKGGGGAFGFTRMVAFAHVLETLLDRLRDGLITLGPELASLLLRATDALSDLVAAERDEAPPAAGFEAALLADLERASLPSDNESHVADHGNPYAAPHTGADAGAQAAETPEAPSESTYRIAFRPQPSLFRNANEPLLLIRELHRLGRVSVTAILDTLPSLSRLDPEDAHIGWDIDLQTAEALARVEEVFDFVTDHCDLSIRAVGAQAPADAPPAPTAPQAAPLSVAPSGAAPAPAPASAPPQDKPAPPARAEANAQPQTVRVDVEKVDRLVNLVGELVINQAMLVQLGSQLPAESCAGLIGGLETLSQHLRELQDGVMAIRTQPVRSVFSRMPRLMRELSAQLGKEVRLVLTGEGTEIDKTVIEQLADPLTHLLRNALDHGIETPAERQAAGKPPCGIIHLAAEHRSGRIVIEVADDGRGIDRGRVLARARQRGLMPPDNQPTDEEIDNLIFLPGFSTAEVVSSVSGRGVGMDVVRRNIQALGGRITLHSQAGAGSRFVLSLPLTLAILDGMIVAVGAESYIVPLANIVESLRPKRADIHAVAGSGDVVAIRGQYVPLIHLARHFRVPDAVADPSSGIVVVVENENAGPVGLVVDELIGQQQVVVKSLEANYGAVAEIGGATILGNGRVALILDIGGLRDRAAACAPRAQTTRQPAPQAAQGMVA
jgi:two-component system chemotaxis sensor kinase CheA